MTKHPISRVWTLAVVAVVVAACGGTTTTTASAGDASTTAAPTTVTSVASEPTTTTAITAPGTAEVRFTGADGVESVIADTSRIVSLSGDISEVISALGLGDAMVAIDVTTTYPDAAKALPVVGFGQQLAAEPVLSFEPTLVIGDQLTGPAEAIAQIRDAGVPVVILPSQIALDGVAEKIHQIAQILGVDDAGNQLAEQVQSEIDAATTLAAGAVEEPRALYLYTRGPETLLIFGNGMATNAMINGAHAIDAGAESGVNGAVPLTPEAIAAANPDVIVLPEGGVEALGGLDAVKALPGIGQTPAGQNGRFLSYDEAYFFNLGPRAGEALMQFVKDLHPELAS